MQRDSCRQNRQLHRQLQAEQKEHFQPRTFLFSVLTLSSPPSLTFNLTFPPPPPALQLNILTAQPPLPFSFSPPLDFLPPFLLHSSPHNFFLRVLDTRQSFHCNKNHPQCPQSLLFCPNPVAAYTLLHSQFQSCNVPSLNLSSTGSCGPCFQGHAHSPTKPCLHNHDLLLLLLMHFAVSSVFQTPTLVHYTWHILWKLVANVIATPILLKMPSHVSVFP